MKRLDLAWRLACLVLLGVQTALLWYMLEAVGTTNRLLGGILEGGTLSRTILGLVERLYAGVDFLFTMAGLGGL